jgi:uncharacterized membrane protein
MPKIVEHISLAIGVIGVSVILWGVLLGVLRLVRLEWASITGRDSLVEREDLRHHLGYYLLLGLEFLIAADIVHRCWHQHSLTSRSSAQSSRSEP